MHWKTLKKVLEHSKPPGYRQERQRPKRKIGPFEERVRQILNISVFVRVLQNAGSHEISSHRPTADGWHCTRPDANLMPPVRSLLVSSLRWVGASFQGVKIAWAGKFQSTHTGRDSGRASK